MRKPPLPLIFLFATWATLAPGFGCTDHRTSDALSPELVVGAAASTSEVVSRLIHEYEQENPALRIEANFAASGVLLQQASHGARMDLFIFADGFTAAMAEDKGIDLATILPVAHGSLVLAVPAGKSPGHGGLEYLLRDDVQKVCIGDPAFVPLGRYARIALLDAGLWERIGEKIVLAGSASQARQYIGTGEVDAAILYATDAAQLGDKVVVVSSLANPPVVYVAAVSGESRYREETVKLAHWLASPQASKIFETYGFKPLTGGTAWPSM